MTLKANKIIISLLLLMATTVSIYACKESESKLPGDLVVADDSLPIDPNPVSLGWVLQTKAFGSVPEYIKVYKSPSILEFKNAIAYIAIADISKGASFQTLGNASGYKTPTEFYESSDKKDVIIMNAGYFWEGSSLSLLCRNNQVIVPNNQIEYRTDANGKEIPYFPTRGVFGLMTDGTFKVNWVYTNNNTTYAYPESSPNRSGSTPLPMPSSAYPQGGIVWNAKTAIGGGPVLIKDGKYVNSYQSELFDAASGVGPTINNPRTAIGITKGNKLVFFVCEGRNMTPDVTGFTLEEVAKIMKSIGCIEALNLDGGGSSCMLINGIQTIKPSDGFQRKIVTGVVIK